MSRHTFGEMIHSEKNKGPTTLSCIRQHYTFTLPLSLWCSTAMCQFSNLKTMSLCLLTRFDMWKIATSESATLSRQPLSASRNSVKNFSKA